MLEVLCHNDNKISIEGIPSLTFYATSTIVLMEKQKEIHMFDSGQGTTKSTLQKLPYNMMITELFFIISIRFCLEPRQTSFETSPTTFNSRLTSLMTLSNNNWNSLNKFL